MTPVGVKFACSWARAERLPNSVGRTTTTKRPNVYTTLGQECGCCGHRHPTVQQAGRSLDDYRRREFSDRIVVAVAADAPWPPTEGRYLNDTELEALYADGGIGVP